MKLPLQTQELITRWRLGHLATVTPGGRPSVSPKGTFIVVDDSTLAFGEIRSPQTVTNLTHNPECEINFVDAFTRKGARIRGQGRMVRRDTAAFDALYPAFEEIWGELCDRMNLIVKIDVTEVKPLTTPPYDTGATEEEMIALYKAKFLEMYP
ncbi:MAG: pyridoxamine 5'-phosphate oxidase family protein [Pseudomonadota bacterium]